MWSFPCIPYAETEFETLLDCTRTGRRCGLLLEAVSRHLKDLRKAERHVVNMLRRGVTFMNCREQHRDIVIIKTKTGQAFSREQNPTYMMFIENEEVPGHFGPVVTRSSLHFEALDALMFFEAYRNRDSGVEV